MKTTITLLLAILLTITTVNALPGADESYNYTVLNATGSGTWTPPENVYQVDVMLVAGGGSGGKGYLDAAGGGGAGEVAFYYNQSVQGNTSYYVGSGGIGSGINGENTTFANLKAIGGGGGANYRSIGKDGGSGGGGSDRYAPGGTSIAIQYGNAGGAGNPAPQTSGQRAGGGGGGANGSGIDSTLVDLDGQFYDEGIGGDGGPGINASFFTGPTLGENGYFAGGGGGSHKEKISIPGEGGIGGGGDGEKYHSTVAYRTPPGNGIANTGSGGGGSNAYTSGSGGSGIIVLRYKTQFFGCSNEKAENYDPTITDDDGTCRFPSERSGTRYVANQDGQVVGYRTGGQVVYFEESKETPESASLSVAQTQAQEFRVQIKTVWNNIQTWLRGVLA